MDAPRMFESRRVAPETYVLPSHLPIPGLGGLAINAYVIRAQQPVLVDAGLGALREDFMSQLGRIMDPADLRWIWITHTDADHIGALKDVLERAPHAKVVTTFLGMGKFGMLQPISPERIHLLNPGQDLDVGDRVLTALRPPTFDAPETTGLFDSKTGALFSSDCFGALTTEVHVDADDIPESELAEGLVTWATIDAPWLHSTAELSFNRVLEAVQAMKPSTVLSSHLPPATGMTERLLGLLRKAREAQPFVGPDQRAFAQLLGADA